MFLNVFKTLFKGFKIRIDDTQLGAHLAEGDAAVHGFTLPRISRRANYKLDLAALRAASLTRANPLPPAHLHDPCRFPGNG